MQSPPPGGYSPGDQSPAEAWLGTGGACKSGGLRFNHERFIAAAATLRPATDKHPTANQILA